MIKTNDWSNLIFVIESKTSSLSNKAQLIKLTFKDAAIKCMEIDQPNDTRLFLNMLELLCEAQLESERLNIQSISLQVAIIEGLKSKFNEIKQLMERMKERGTI